jgi:hypothetical protein
MRVGVLARLHVPRGGAPRGGGGARAPAAGPRRARRASPPGHGAGAGVGPPRLRTLAAAFLVGVFFTLGAAAFYASEAARGEGEGAVRSVRCGPHAGGRVGGQLGRARAARGGRRGSAAARARLGARGREARRPVAAVAPVPPAGRPRAAPAPPHAGAPG